MVAYNHTIGQTLKHFSEKYGISSFVETGTFTGKTTEIASAIFSSVYTIELGERLFNKAKEKFKDVRNVTCLHGNSPAVLALLVSTIDNNAIFFLDAHWGGEKTVRGDSDSPLLEELAVLAKRKDTYRDLIIIDDLSLFGRKDCIFYPNPKESSLYFPDGGLFEWDWSHVTKEKIIKLFPNKKIEERDDRLFIGIR